MDWREKPSAIEINEQYLAHADEAYVRSTLPSYPKVAVYGVCWRITIIVKGGSTKGVLNKLEDVKINSSHILN